MASKIEDVARKVAHLAGQDPLVSEMRTVIRELMMAVDAAGNLSSPDEECYRNMALDQFGEEGQIEIDADAVVSVPTDGTGDGGAWVQAWMWVDGPDEEDGS